MVFLICSNCSSNLADYRVKKLGFFSFFILDNHKLRWHLHQQLWIYWPFQNCSLCWVCHFLLHAEQSLWFNICTYKDKERLSEAEYTVRSCKRCTGGVNTSKTYCVKVTNVWLKDALLIQISRHESVILFDS